MPLRIGSLRALTGALLGVILAAPLASCASSNGVSVEADYQTLQSIEALAASADLVVVGTLGESLGTELDGGGDPEDGGEASGLVMEFFGVTVDQTLVGASPDPLVVAWPEMDDVSVEGATPVEPGQQLVLFLRHRDSESAPGIESFDSFYVPVSGDNGVFDVVDGTATARSAEVHSLRSAAPAATDEAFSVPVEQLTRLMADGAPGS